MLNHILYQQSCRSRYLLDLLARVEQHLMSDTLDFESFIAIFESMWFAMRYVKRLTPTTTAQLAESVNSRLQFPPVETEFRLSSHSICHITFFQTSTNSPSYRHTSLVEIEDDNPLAHIRQMRVQRFS